MKTKIYLVSKEVSYGYGENETTILKGFFDKSKAKEYIDEISKNDIKIENAYDDFCSVVELLEDEISELGMTSSQYSKFYNSKKYWRNNIKVFKEGCEKYLDTKYDDETIKAMYNIYKDNDCYDAPYYKILTITLE